MRLGCAAQGAAACADDGIAAVQRRERRECLQASAGAIERGAPAFQEEPRGAAQALSLSCEPPAIAFQPRAHREAQPSARGGQRQLEVADVRNDERSGRGGRRRPRVGCEIAQRRVLLVAHGRHDRNAGGSDGADDRLVAEGKEILEAATSAGEDDDVHVRMAGELGERGDDRVRGALPLHPRLADHDLRRREAGTDRCHEVASRSGVCAGEDPDRARNAREATLPLRREQALGGELALELLEREQVRAEPDPLDRRRPESELRLLLVDLRATGDVDGLAFGEVELEAVVRAPRDRDVERRAGLRILQRQEDVGPGVVAAELGDLPLHPQGGQPAEVHPDAAVERRDGEDLAVAVHEVLDLRHLARVSPVATPSAASARTRPRPRGAVHVGRGRRGGRRAR